MRQAGSWLGDVASALIVIGAFAKLLPAIAAVASVVYYVCGIREMLRRRRLEKPNDVIADLQAKVEELRERRDDHVLIVMCLSLGGTGIAVAMLVLFYGVL